MWSPRTYLDLGHKLLSRYLKLNEMWCGECPCVFWPLSVKAWANGLFTNQIYWCLRIFFGRLVSGFASCSQSINWPEYPKAVILITASYHPCWLTLISCNSSNYNRSPYDACITQLALFYYTKDFIEHSDAAFFSSDVHAFNCLGYIKKYADSGTRTNIVCFPRLLLARVQLPGLHKEICR